MITGRSPLDGTVSHMENFFDCVKSRKEPNAPVETEWPRRVRVISEI